MIRMKLLFPDIFIRWSLFDMRHFWQWLCGYLCVLLKGKQINRFLNLCSKNGIRLWKISRDVEHVVRVHIGLKDFYYIKPYLRKTKTKARILQKKGFPFWCYRHPGLKWMLVLLFFAVCIFVHSFRFIWKIEINGNERISSYELNEFLISQNIETGIKKNSVDCMDLEYQLRQNFKEMGWVSVYIENTKLCIEIKESLYDEFEFEPNEEGISYPLIAEKDAVIYSVVTRQGTALIQKGQFVKKGDILVLGECEILDDAGEKKDVLHFRADALIYGDVKRKFVLPLSEMELLSLKISQNFTDDMLNFIANKKIEEIIEKLEKNGIIILEKNVIINKDEKNIMFIGEITTREQIGINISLEE